jgi:protein phosphatase
LALKPHIILCPDQIREEVTGDINDQSQNGRVFDIFYDRLEVALKDPTVDYIGLDATFLRKAYRSPVFEIIRDSGVEHEITVIHVDLTKEQAMDRMKKRVRQVPEHVIDSMIQKFTPITDEEKERYGITSIIKLDATSSLIQQGRTAFIGDVQSCWDQLKQLLYYLGFYCENGEWYNSGACKEIIHLGDLTDRGLDSVSVLKTIMQLTEKGWCRGIRGNHDDKLMRYLKGNPVRAAHGLELTIEHLSLLTTQEKAKILRYLESLPTYLKTEINGKKYVAVHAWWQDWMDGKEDKAIKERNMYGVIGSETCGEPNRVLWWEHDEYLSKDHIVVFGHYATKVDLPNAKGVDLGACFGRQLAAFIPGANEDTWIEVQSDWDWNTRTTNVISENVLTYKELFAKLKINPEEIVDEIEEDWQLIKRRYNITTDNGETFELTIANASKGLFTADTGSYAQQLAKGIVYNRHTKEIVSVTLPKFYNYGEKAVVNDTLRDFINSGKYQFQFVEKLDGTQIARFVYKNKVFWNTRSIIISEDNTGILSEDSTDFFKYTLDAVKNFTKQNYLDPAVHSDKTLIFELLHPDNLTIVPYGGIPKLSLLAYSQKDPQGRWENMYTVNAQMTEFDLPAVYSSNGSVDEAAELLKSIEDKEGIAEGFVANIVDGNGKVYFRIKFKTPSFFEAMRLAHHCTYDRVVEVCTGHNLRTKDEFVAYLKKDKDAFPEELLEKYQTMFDDYKQYMDFRDAYAEGIKVYFEKFVSPMVSEGQSRKDIALAIKDFPFASHLFSMLDNKPVNEEVLNKYFKFDKEEVKPKLESLLAAAYPKAEV